MNRRAFFCRAASLLPLPAFVRAASLWLPKERPKLVFLDEVDEEDMVTMHEIFMSVYSEAIARGFERECKALRVFGRVNSVLKGSDLPGATVFVDDERWGNLMEKGE